VQIEEVEEMARPLRIEYEGALYHVMSRGNARNRIYLDDQDRTRFTDLLAEVCKRFNWCCHAYCLMGNHYHLLIETPEANLSDGMRHLNGVYTQSFNRVHRRVGHIFQGRYKGILVEKEGYLLELIRYIVLNPVRAGMVHSADDWQWSSHRFMLGIEASSWFSTTWVLGQFGSPESSARQYYRNFVDRHSDNESFIKAAKDKQILGSRAFIEKALARIDRVSSEVPRMQSRPPQRPLSEYEAECETRNETIKSAFESGRYTMKAIADNFWCTLHHG
jgi:putative transposase